MEIKKEDIKLSCEKYHVVYMLNKAVGIREFEDKNAIVLFAKTAKGDFMIIKIIKGVSVSI